MANEKWSSFPLQSSIATGDALVGVHAGDNARLNPFSFGQDILVHSITVGQGNFSDVSNTNLAVGVNSLSNNFSGTNNSGIGYGALEGVVSGNNNIGFGALTGLSNDGSNNIYIGYNAAQLLGTTSNGNDNTIIGSNTGNGGGNSSGVDMLGGANNTWIGEYVTGDTFVTNGTIGIGKWATPNASTGSTSGTFGPGIAIGASSFPVGFRGDGSALPAGNAHYWRVKINDTYYNVPILPDASTIQWPSTGTLATTSGSSGIVNSGLINQLAYYAAAGTTLSGLTIANQGILTTNGSGVPSWVSLSAGQLLVGTTSGAPVAAAINSGTNILVANGSGSITVGITGVISPANGGTGINNSTNTLTINANSTINQNVSTAATPAFVSIATSPAVSSASSLATGTAYQNTLGYDVVLTVYLAISAATAASILLGVGPTTTPTQQTIISGLTLAALGIVPVNIYLPNNYYALLSTSGTITQTISGQLAMPV